MNKYIAKQNGKIIASGEFKDEASFKTALNVPVSATIEFTSKDAAKLFNMYLDVRDRVLSEQYDYLENSSNTWIDSTIIAQNKATRDSLRKARVTIIDASYFAANKLLDIANTPNWAKPLVFRYSTAYKRVGEPDRIINEWVDFLNEWVKISK